MVKITVDSSTGRVTLVEVPDTVIPETPVEPTVEERVAALETLILQISGVI